MPDNTALTRASGYNFKSLRDISTFLEPSGSGVSSLWTRTTALRYDCTVISGYPERVDVTDRWPANPEYYNSVIGVNRDGETVVNYRKSHLYYTDETWALEGNGFYGGRLPDLGRTAIGICMDINPYKFQTPWEDCEFAQHALDCGARLVIVSMAWLTNADPWEFSRSPGEPDLETLMYWIARLEPIIKIHSNQEVIVVFANRTGTEDEATYAGTSAVVGIKEGEVLVYGILGRGEKELLVVDTDEKPFARLVHRTANGVPAADSGDSLSGEEATSPERNAPEPERQNSHPKHEPIPNPFPDTRVPEELVERLRALGPTTTDGMFEEPHNEDGYYRDASNTESWISKTVAEKNNTSRRDHATQLRGQTASQPQYVSRNDPELFYGRASVPAQDLSGLKTRTRSSSVDSSASVTSSKMYWAPQSQFTGADETTQWTTPDNADAISPTELGPSKGRHNRHSFRSDVSIWSNQPGRSQTAVVQMSMQDQLASRRVEDFLRDSADRPATTSHADIDRFSQPGRTDQYKPTPRRRATDRSNSGTKDDGQSRGTHKRRASDARQRVESSRAESRGKNAVADGRGSTIHMDYRESVALFSALGQRDGTDSRMGATSIPIAMDSGDLFGSNQTRAEPRPHNGEPPILRPASRSRLRGRSSSNRGPEETRPLKSEARAHRQQVRSTTPGVQEGRQLSRGRQRTSSTGVAHDSRPSRNRNGHGSGSSRPPGEQIDLSQFNLIEEYPSATCPMHGSRSHSAAQHRPGSRRRESASRQQRPGSRDVQRRNTQDSPAPATRRESSSRRPTHQSSSSALRRKPSRDIAPPNVDSPREASSYNTTYERTSPALRRKPSKDVVPSKVNSPRETRSRNTTQGNTSPALKKKSSKASPNTIREMTQSVQLGKEDRKQRLDTKSIRPQQVDVKECSPLDLKYGPKTPVAMVLLSEQEKPQEEAITQTWNGLGISGMESVTTSRPRSAVW